MLQMTANPTKLNTEYCTFPSAVLPQLKEVRRVQGFRYSSEVTHDELVSIKKKFRGISHAEEKVSK